MRATGEKLMKSHSYVRVLAVIMTYLACILSLSIASPQSAHCVTYQRESSLWAHDNLFAWETVLFDTTLRGPEERAQMLERLGFKHFVYDWRENNTSTFDAQIEALQKHGIDLLGWWFPFDPDDPAAKATLETFKHHHVKPQLWVMQSLRDFPKTTEEWSKWLPEPIAIPKTSEEWGKLSEADKTEMQKKIRQAFVRFSENTLTKIPQEQESRVQREAARIAALVKLAAPYGCKVELYNHNGWFGIMDNQVAIIERLKELGVTDVGIAYNFWHARDELHDDTVNFPALWKKIQPYVAAVAVSGTHLDDVAIYPSQGDSELEMMRTIQESRWRGPIGLVAAHPGDAQVTLSNCIAGLDWLAAELKQPGSGGSPPFPLAAAEPQHGGALSLEFVRFEERLRLAGASTTDIAKYEEIVRKSSPDLAKEEALLRKASPTEMAKHLDDTRKVLQDIRQVEDEQAQHPTLKISALLPDFALKGVDGRIHTAADYSASPLLVVMFISNHCPTAQMYEGREKTLFEDYAPKGVSFVAIQSDGPKATLLSELNYTDVDDSFDSMVVRAAYRKFPFPYLYDGDEQAAARKFGPKATPHIFIFDKNRKLRVEGRIDDNVRESMAKTHDTRDAIEALLAGRPVPVRCVGLNLPTCPNGANKRTVETSDQEVRP